MAESTEQLAQISERGSDSHPEQILLRFPRQVQVLYMGNSLDEYAVHQLKRFDETKLKPKTKEELHLGDKDAKKRLRSLKSCPYH